MALNNTLALIRSKGTAGIDKRQVEPGAVGAFLAQGLVSEFPVNGQTFIKIREDKASLVDGLTFGVPSATAIPLPTPPPAPAPATLTNGVLSETERLTLQFLRGHAHGVTVQSFKNALETLKAKGLIRTDKRDTWASTDGKRWFTRKKQRPEIDGLARNTTPVSAAAR